MQKLLLSILIPVFSSCFSQVNMDSLWKIWNDPNQSDSLKLDAMRTIAFDGYLFSNPDTCYYYAQKQFDYAKLKKNMDGMGSALCTQGSATYYKGNYKRAIELYKKGLGIYNLIGYKKGIASALVNIGTVYAEQGNIIQAMDCYNKALKIYNAEADAKNNVGSIYNNYAKIYQEINDLDKALDYYQKALEIFRKDNDKSGIALAMENIGVILTEKGKTSKVEEYFLESLKIAEEINDKFGAASCLVNLSATYVELGDHKKAKEFALRGLKIAEELGDKNGISAALNTLAYNSRLIGNNNEASDYSERALKFAQEIGASREIRAAALSLYDIYKNSGNYKKSLEMHVLYTKMQDSVRSKEARGGIIRKEIQYSYDKQKELDKKEHDNQLALASEKLKRNKYAVVGLSILFGLVLLIILLVIRQTKLKSEQKSLQLEQKLLRAQMNPHFIFNSLTSIDSFIYTKKPEAARQFLSDFAKLIRNILESSREEYISLDKEIKTLEHYLSLQKLNLEDNFTYEINFDNNLVVEEIRVPPMLLQPFIENALEHGISNSKHGHIEIVFMQENDKLIIKITDNGIGINKVQKVLSNHVSLATTITRERLLNINLRKRKKIKFQIQDLSETNPESSGTAVTFSIPFA